MKNVLHVFSIINTAEAFFDGQFRYLGNFGFSIHIITSPSNSVKSFCQSNDAKYTLVEISRSNTPIKDIKAVIAICNYIKKEKIDIVVGHTPKGALVSMIASFLLRVPHRIYYRHGLIYTTKKGFKRYTLKLIEKLTSSLSTRIISVSPSMASLCVKDNINTDVKQKLIGKGTCGGIDTINKFNPVSIDQTKLDQLREKYNIQKNAFVVGFAGRLCKDKGIAELVDGFNLLEKWYPEKKFVLILVGYDDIRDKLDQHIINELITNENIIKTGRISADEMPYYYSLMSVFVFPSHREGFGMSVIEASAMEIPVLVSKSHGCIDTIVENITGLYIELSAEPVANGVSALFDVDSRKQLGKHGRIWVSENYDQSVLWPEVVKMYQEMTCINYSSNE
jgi:glycosyltransferase involved in cell wall biosynthesis